jgi:hypothetical protein
MDLVWILAGLWSHLGFRISRPQRMRVRLVSYPCFLHSEPLDFALADLGLSFSVTMEETMGCGCRRFFGTNKFHTGGSFSHI